MIVQEIVTIGEREFRRTYSDLNKYIIQDQTGNKYEEAIDVFEATYTYTETDEDIPVFRAENEEN